MISRQESSQYQQIIEHDREKRRDAVYDAAMAWYKAKYGSAGDITEIVKYREARLRDACAVAEEVERV